MVDITATPLVAPEYQFVDADGEVLVGGKVYTFESGGVIPKDTYTNSTEDVANTNPVILDNFGKAPIYLKGTYKIILKDKNDVEIYTQDYVSAYSFFDFTGLSATVPDLNSTKTKAEIKTTDYTVVVGDRGKTILVDATSVDVNIQLPDPATDDEFVRDVFKIIIKKIDKSSHKVNINPDAGDKIDGDTKFILHDFGDFAEVHLKEPDWHIVASQQRGTMIGVTTASIPIITLKDNGKTYSCDTSGGNIAITLPDTSVVGKGFAVTFKRTTFDAQTVTINTTGGQLIDNGSNLILDNGVANISGQAVTVKCDGTHWSIISFFSGITNYHDYHGDWTGSAHGSPPNGTNNKNPLVIPWVKGSGDVIQVISYLPKLKQSILEISFDYDVRLSGIIPANLMVGIAFFEGTNLLQSGFSQALIDGVAFNIAKSIHSTQTTGNSITFTVELKGYNATAVFTGWQVDTQTDNQRSGFTIREYI